MGGYWLAAEFSRLVRQLVVVLFCLLVGIYCTAVPTCGEAEPDGRVPYAVICRQAFALCQYPGGDPRGLRLPRYGIQIPSGANALMLVRLLLASLPSDQQQLSRAVALGWLEASPPCGCCRRWQGVLAWHERHQTLYRYRYPAVYADAGAGRLDCIQDWSGR